MGQSALTLKFDFTRKMVAAYCGSLFNVFARLSEQVYGGNSYPEYYQAHDDNLT
jgi:hypothetical protein